MVFWAIQAYIWIGIGLAVLWEPLGLIWFLAGAVFVYASVAQAGQSYTIETRLKRKR